MNKEQFIVLLILISSFLSGCATRHGKLRDGKEYKEYDVHFDKESGRFSVPFEWRNEKKDLPLETITLDVPKEGLKAIK